MKLRQSILSIIAIILCFACTKQTQSPFSFVSNHQSIELLENGHAVFSYQKQPKTLDGKYICTNFIHPLYDLKNDTLTELSPADHPYHRGIFWAWHQITIHGESVGDGWILENMEQEVVSVEKSTKNHSAQLQTDVIWRSPLYENGKPFVSERTLITVYPLQDSVRKIDFAIALQALVPNVEIGGSDDEKGYGGFCARIKLPNDIQFTSANGLVIPQNLQIEAGPWMDFSGSFGRINNKSGVSILCHPETANYPVSWILRSKSSMQNIVFPGRNRIEIPIEKPIVLYYRLIVHNGNASNINLTKLHKEYMEEEVHYHE